MFKVCCTISALVETFGPFLVVFRIYLALTEINDYIKNKPRKEKILHTGDTKSFNVHQYQFFRKSNKLSRFTCCVLRIMCHLSLTPTATATATDPPPPKCPTMNKRLVNDQKQNQKNTDNFQNLPSYSYPILAIRSSNRSLQSTGKWGSRRGKTNNKTTLRLID